MAQSNLNQTEDHSVKDSDPEAAETDWSAVAAEMPATSASQTGSLAIRNLQNRAASALSGAEPAPEPLLEDTSQAWPARRQLAFFLGAGAICWMLILTPIILL